MLAMLVVAGSGILSSCNPFRASASDLAEDFYGCQKDSSLILSGDFFANDKIAREAADVISMREEKFGPYESIRKIGSNRSISMELTGKTETVIYMFEVTCERGRTRETLTVTRNGGSEPFRITEYTIENLPRTQDPAPVGTSST